MSWSKRLKRITANPYLNLAIAIVILVSAGQEVISSFAEDLRALRLGTHHGLALLALAQILKILPELTEAVEKVEEGAEGIEKEPGGEP